VGPQLIVKSYLQRDSFFDYRKEFGEKFYTERSRGKPMWDHIKQKTDTARYGFFHFREKNGNRFEFSFLEMKKRGLR
jgi:hypothetical protein